MIALRNIRPIVKWGGAVLLLFLLASCSTTKLVPEDDQLFIGLTKIDYQNYEKTDHFAATKEEMEAALATEPNGAFFGSSYYRTPFPYRLWIWNAFSESHGHFGKWITKTFGKPPVLMSWVNPELRARVGESVLKNHGYFQGSVNYQVVEQKNPKKAKIGYEVNLGPAYTLDSICYLNFPFEADSLIQSTRGEAYLHKGDAFKVSNLDAERSRISNLLRNNGYYYYQPSYASYMADTVAKPQQVQLRFQLSDSLSDMTMRKWYIGKIRLELRKNNSRELLEDSLVRRSLSVYFNGKRSPIRAGIILRNMKLRPRQLYSYQDYVESANELAGNGLFSMIDFKFTPRPREMQLEKDSLYLHFSDSLPSRQVADSLDLTLSCVFDKPYDFYVESNVTGKTSGWLGPGMKVGLTKRNAFRGGEKIDVNLRGAYEWQTNRTYVGGSKRLNSYSYGVDASIEIPRLIPRFFSMRKRFRRTGKFVNLPAPTTTLSASTDVINRAQYFKRHVVSGELTYSFQTSTTSLHQWTPLALQYNYMTKHTEEFDSIMDQSPYLKVSMKDQFIPMMRYTYIRTSPSTRRHPLTWQTTISEAANLLSLGYKVAGEKWGTKDKTMFKNPYAQFVKLETDLRKTWRLSDHDQLVAHASAGVIWAYGNSTIAPYLEQFYVGGANSIRAFTVRSIGPGIYRSTSSRSSYLDQTGDMKLLFNVEYRPRLFGNLYGALFVDAGNVWTLREDSDRPGAKFQAKNAIKEMALGTGIGFRYDLEFFVIRVDWGLGLHTPQSEKHGIYNMPSFRGSHSLHFAIGYPF
ncbi:MAG: BamA/TamA family outer membrane protein [Prevotella sp.]|nr:BamA/TamA family outer membrane protein [Prevotella sp.]